MRVRNFSNRLLRSPSPDKAREALAANDPPENTTDYTAHAANNAAAELAAPPPTRELQLPLRAHPCGR
eukprot:12486676-Alexandrium_andersonii.AAC.1